MLKFFLHLYLNKLFTLDSLSGYQGKKGEAGITIQNCTSSRESNSGNKTITAGYKNVNYWNFQDYLYY